MSGTEPADSANRRALADEPDRFEELVERASGRYGIARQLIVSDYWLRGRSDWGTFSSHRPYFPLLFAALTGRSGHGFAIPLSL